MNVIFPEDYAAWAQCVRSNQIPADELARLMRDNPAFARWYREKHVAELEAAIEEFSKAASMRDGPSLAMQRHDPTWTAWKKLCDVTHRRVQ